MCKKGITVFCESTYNFEFASLNLSYIEFHLYKNSKYLITKKNKNKGGHLQVGGLPSALAISTMFGMTVLTPLPLPSTLACNLGILYL